MDLVQIATGGTWSFVLRDLFLSERFCLFRFVVVLLVLFDWDGFFLLFLPYQSCNYNTMHIGGSLQTLKEPHKLDLAEGLELRPTLTV